MLVIHLWASTPRSIYFRASLENENADKKYSCGEDIIALQSFNGIPFSVMMGAVAPGGKVSVSGNSLIVEDADEVTLYVDVETAFALNSFAKKSYGQFKNARLASKTADIALKKICFAMNAHYAYIKKAHLDENPALYSRMQLSLGEKNPESENTNVSADELLKNTESPEYAELYFKYMRYLYLNSTKPRAKLPPLENGLLSNPDADVWHQRYYFDRLYPYGLTGCLCNAKKSDEALFKLLKRVNKNGKRTAFEMFGAEGSTAFDSTDIWGDTAPCGTSLDSSYNAAGLARLATLITEYYESTLNKKFIRKNAGILKNACAFFETYLVLVEEKTRAVLNPAFSKGENRFIKEGNAELEKEIALLFKSALKAFNYAEIPSDSDCVVKAKEMLSKLKAEPKAEVPLNLPSSLTGGSVHDAGLIARKIISSEMNGGVIEITLLPDAKGALATGEVKNLALKGNLFANLTWKDGRIVSGNLFTKTSGSFVDTTVIWYQGKKFNARLMNGSISLMNVLPTTV